MDGLVSSSDFEHGMVLFPSILKEKPIRIKALSTFSAPDIRQTLGARNADPARNIRQMIELIYQNHKSRQRDIN
jgi:hypothetical protein